MYSPAILPAAPRLSLLPEQPRMSLARVSSIGTRASIDANTAGNSVQEIVAKTPATSHVAPIGLDQVIITAHNEHGDGPILTSFGFNWVVVGVLGRGVFGDIYHVQDKFTGQYAACKVEPYTAPRRLLQTETQMMQSLSMHKSVPRVYEFNATPTHEYVIMELVGKSLAELRSALNGRFTLSSGIRLAILSLQGIRDVHTSGICHGDIKPGNFALGVEGRARDCYIIDFGLSRPFPTEQKKANFRGTVKYASLHSHEHQNVTARDDLWSWYYMVLEWLNGSLPWSELCLTSKQPRDEVEELKRLWNHPGICANLPPQFLRVQEYLSILGFFDFPDYDYIFSLLAEALNNTHTNWDTLYDWETPSGQALVAAHKAKFGMDPYIPTGALGRSNVAELNQERGRVRKYHEDRHLRAHRRNSSDSEDSVDLLEDEDY